MNDSRWMIIDPNKSNNASTNPAIVTQLPERSNLVRYAAATTLIKTCNISNAIRRIRVFICRISIVKFDKAADTIKKEGSYLFT